jgi:hypothetical protein
MEERKDREQPKPYVKPELKEFGTIHELTAGTTNVDNKNDMTGGPVKT